MSALSLLGNLRVRVRDALPSSLGMCLTLRANPLLGLAFLLLRRRFHVDGMIFEVPLKGMSWSSLATYWFDDYEVPEREFCRRFIRRTDRVCELGGCLGIVSMTINRLLAAPEAHLVVEANPTLMPFLEKNRECNHGRFKVLQSAVGDGSPLPLDVSSGLLTSTRAVNGTAAEVEMVPGCTVAALFSAHGPFDVMVMDVEGAEAEVFLGEEQVWSSVRLIIVEWHPAIIGQEVFERARSVLSAAGFHCIASRDGSRHIVETWEKKEA